MTRQQQRATRASAQTPQTPMNRARGRQVRGSSVAPATREALRRRLADCGLTVVSAAACLGIPQATLAALLDGSMLTYSRLDYDLWPERINAYLDRYDDALALVRRQAEDIREALVVANLPLPLPLLACLQSSRRNSRTARTGRTGRTRRSRANGMIAQPTPAITTAVSSSIFSHSSNNRLTVADPSGRRTVLVLSLTPQTSQASEAPVASYVSSVSPAPQTAHEEENYACALSLV